MANTHKTILVAGATGRQGGAVVTHLLKNNFNVRALSRTPNSIHAQVLATKGVTIVKGDMGDPASLDSAMRGCDGVFSIQNYFEHGAEKEVQFGKNMADAAKRNGISHFIYSSLSAADERTGIPHFETKNDIEQYIASTGIPATIFRPVKFMENYYLPQVFKGILGGKFFDAIQPGKTHAMIATDDIGAYVACAFSDPDKYVGRVFDLAGDELTNEAVAETMSAVLGSKIKFKRLPLFVVKLVMDRELYLMFRWFNQRGFIVNLAETKKSFPTVAPTSLKKWLTDENWQRWNKKGTV